MRYRSVLSVGLILLAPSALRAQGQRSLLLRADRAAADSSWSAGFRSAITSASNDVVLLWPGAPVVKGQTDIAKLLLVVQGVGNLTRAARGQGRPDSIRVTWQPMGAALSADSSLGCTWGVVVGADAPGASPRIGRYIGAWRREAAGWQLEAFMLTAAPGDDNVPVVTDLPLEHPALSASGATAPFVAGDLAFARLAGDSGAGIAFERWAAPDAHAFFGGGLLVEGPQAIGRAVTGSETWSWYPVFAGASVDGSMGWTVGEAVISTADGHSGPSKYLTIWKRQPDGSVKFLTDGGSGRPVRP
jgi:hypothetical protein